MYRVGGKYREQTKRINKWLYLSSFVQRLQFGQNNMLSNSPPSVETATAETAASSPSSSKNSSSSFETESVDTTTISEEGKETTGQRKRKRDDVNGDGNDDGKDDDDNEDDGDDDDHSEKSSTVAVGTKKRKVRNRALTIAEKRDLVIRYLNAEVLPLSGYTNEGKNYDNNGIRAFLIMEDNNVVDHTQLQKWIKLYKLGLFEVFPNMEINLNCKRDATLKYKVYLL